MSKGLKTKLIKVMVSIMTFAAVFVFMHTGGSANAAFDSVSADGNLLVDSGFETAIGIGTTVGTFQNANSAATLSLDTSNAYAGSNSLKVKRGTEAENQYMRYRLANAFSGHKNFKMIFAIKADSGTMSFTPQVLLFLTGNSPGYLFITLPTVTVDTSWQLYSFSIEFVPGTDGSDSIISIYIDGVHNKNVVATGVAAMDLDFGLYSSTYYLDSFALFEKYDAEITLLDGNTPKVIAFTGATTVEGNALTASDITSSYANGVLTVEDCYSAITISFSDGTDNYTANVTPYKKSITKTALYTVAVTVKDTFGNPIENASVTGGGYTLSHDNDGVYTNSEVDSAALDVIVTAAGFAGKSVTLSYSQSSAEVILSRYAEINAVTNNMLSNPGFEDEFTIGGFGASTGVWGTNGGTISRSSERALTGGYSLKIASNGQPTGYRFKLSELKQNTDYLITYYIYAEAGATPKSAIMFIGNQPPEVLAYGNYVDKVGANSEVSMNILSEVESGYWQKVEAVFRYSAALGVGITYSYGGIDVVIENAAFADVAAIDMLFNSNNTAFYIDNMSILECYDAAVSVTGDSGNLEIALNEVIDYCGNKVDISSLSLTIQDNVLTISGCAGDVRLKITAGGEDFDITLTQQSPNINKIAAYDMELIIVGADGMDITGATVTASGYSVESTGNIYTIMNADVTELFVTVYASGYYYADFTLTRQALAHVLTLYAYNGDWQVSGNLLPDPGFEDWQSAGELEFGRFKNNADGVIITADTNKANTGDCSLKIERNTAADGQYFRYRIGKLFSEGSSLKFVMSISAESFAFTFSPELIITAQTQDNTYDVGVISLPSIYVSTAWSLYTFDISYEFDNGTIKTYIDGILISTLNGTMLAGVDINFLLISETYYLDTFGLFKYIDAEFTLKGLSGAEEISLVNAYDAMGNKLTLSSDYLSGVLTVYSAYEGMTMDLYGSSESFIGITPSAHRTTLLAATLKEYVEGKQSELQSYAKESDYSAVKWQTVSAEILKGAEEIASATSQVDVDNAYNSAVTAIDAVDTLADELAAYKLNRKAALDSALGRMNESDYTAENWTAIQEIVLSGKTAIDAAESIDEANSAYNEAIHDLEDVVKITTAVVTPGEEGGCSCGSGILHMESVAIIAIFAVGLAIILTFRKKRAQ